MAQALESVAALLTAMGSSADRPDWPQKKALCLGKRGENMGKILENWKKLGDNVGNIWEKIGKNTEQIWETYGKNCGKLWKHIWETICGIIWGKTRENSKNIRDNLGKLRENVGQK